MKNLQEPNSRHVSTLSSEVPGFMLVVLLGPKSSADPSLCSPKFEPFSRLSTILLVGILRISASSLSNEIHHKSSSASLADPYLFRFLFSFITRRNPSIAKVAKAKRNTTHHPPTLADFELLPHRPLEI